MSWNEAFSHRSEEWSAHMTADIAFYVEVASEADGPLVEPAIGKGRVSRPLRPDRRFAWNAFAFRPPDRRAPRR